MNGTRSKDQIPEGSGKAAPDEKKKRAGRALAIVLPVLSLVCIGIALLYYAVLGDLGKTNEPSAPAQTDEQTEQPETIHLSGGDAAKTPEDDASSEPEPETPTTDDNTDEPETEPDVKLILSRTGLTLAPGEQAGLSVSVQAPYGREVYVFWSSSDEKIATIDPSGMVTAVATGECDMIASADEIRSVCHVTVAEEAVSDYLLPSDTRTITEDDLAGMDRETVSLARNEIFARHGRTFKTESIQTYFDAQSWYTPDPDFDENAPGALSTLEKQNLSFLVAYETQKGWR